MNDKNEQKITVGGIITLVWFAVSMYAIVQLGMNGEIFLMFLVVGQYIIGFGIMALSSGKKKNNLNGRDNFNDEPIVIEHEESNSKIIVDSKKLDKTSIKLGYGLILAGIIFIICLYLNEHPELLGVEINWTKVLFIVIWSFASVWSLKLCYYVHKEYKKENANLNVHDLNDMKKAMEKNEGVHIYNFNGREYEVREEKIDDEHNLDFAVKISPSSKNYVMPEERIVSKKSVSLFPLLLVIVFFLLSIFTLIAVIIKM